MEELLAQEKEMTGSEIEEKGSDQPSVWCLKSRGALPLAACVKVPLRVREQPGNTLWEVGGG